MKTIILTAVGAIAALPALAQQDLGAHVHGHARLDMALNPDGRLIAEFESPKANLVGFEYEARTQEERAAEEAAEAFLVDGTTLFDFTPSAACRFMSAELHEEHLNDEDDHHEGHEHEEHHHEGEDYDEETHSDMAVSYEFNCAAPGRLHWVDVRLFEHFGGFEEIEFVFIDEANQVAAELTPTNTRAEW